MDLDDDELKATRRLNGASKMSEEEIINILSDEIVSLNVGHKKYEQAVKGLLDLYNKEKEKNKRLRKCHLQYEEITGIDLLLPEKEE